MKKFVLKLVVYTFFLLVGLELLVRVLHLYNDRPSRYLDGFQVEKWVPNQTGLAVTGNRKQNTGRYSINSLGFNSVYDHYDPDSAYKNIALIGDSFIEGFHVNVDNSLGKQIEERTTKTRVYEFGYAGYDMADQLHLVKAYANLFSKMDHIILYTRYTDDYDRNTYEVSSRLSLNTPVNRLLKRSKLIVYVKEIGLFDPITKGGRTLLAYLKNGTTKAVKPPDRKALEADRLSNFKKLIKTYNFDKQEITLLLDARLCPKGFFDFLEKEKIRYIDFGTPMDVYGAPTTLVFDQHWNPSGRAIVADVVAEYINTLQN